MNIIDFEKLENKVPQSDGSFICFCPACGEENRNNKSRNHLRVWPSGSFNCVVNTGDRAHNARILQLIGTESNGELTYVAPEPKIQIPKSWPLDTITGLVKTHNYWNKRGISSQTCDYFNMGLAFKGQMAGRSVIPLYSESYDKIIGFTGRAIQKDNKIRWKHIGEKQNWLFPANKVEINKVRTVILLEGPADALALHECNIKNTICLFGTTISSKQLGFLIKSNPEKIIIALNNEASNIGNIASEKLRRTLLSYFSEERIIIGLPEGAKDFCELLETGRRNLIDSWGDKYLKHEQTTV
jgi:5S rRNA maturation endonuclease (ribonuclease M5)